MRDLRFSHQRDMAEIEHTPELDQDLHQAGDRRAALRLSRALSQRELGNQVDETAASSEAVARDGLSGRSGEVPFRGEMEARLGMSLGTAATMLGKGLELEAVKVKPSQVRLVFYNPDGSLMTEWRLNDFGETALRVEGSPGLFVHTTPQSEEAQELGQKLELTHSHGCLHVHPEDRDRLMALGYMAKGVTLVIKKYDEALDLGATN